MKIEQPMVKPDAENCNRFIKLLMFQNNTHDYILLYGFSSSTKQHPYPWRSKAVCKTHRYMWTAILTQAEADAFEQMIISSGEFLLGTVRIASPQLTRRDAVLSGDVLSKVPGPVSGLSCLTEFWNVQKMATFDQIKMALATEGKELLRDIQDLFGWIKQECGIDFLMDGSRFGNYERYDLLERTYNLKIETHKELKLQTTTIRKTAPYSGDLVVNCIAEHRGRV